MKNNMIGRSLTAAAFVLAQPAATASVTATFETIPLSGPESHWNGADGSGGFHDGAHFNNQFVDWGGGSTSWSGFAVSNHTDSTTSGYLNQYSAHPGSGAGGSTQYAIGYDGGAYGVAPMIDFGTMTDLTGMGALIANTTYASLSMQNGDGFGKKFGGASGDDADWLLLTISAYADGTPTGATMEYYLANFQFADNSQDFILSGWNSISFDSLGSADKLVLNVTSSDPGTPTYFAMDNITVPEPSALLLSIAGLGLLARRKR